jgi:hypothetical protein
MVNDKGELTIAPNQDSAFQKVGMGNHGPNGGGKSDSWWRPELRANDYDTFGDAYDDDAKYNQLAEQWAVNLYVDAIVMFNFFADHSGLLSEDYPYLAWVKRLSESGRTHLKLLADFMSIGAVPQRWKDLNPNPQPDKSSLSGVEISGRVDDRKKRIAKTNVCILDYYADDVRTTKVTSAPDLREILDVGATDSRVQFRLYVVEDLSRDVIEALGQKRRFF